MAVILISGTPGTGKTTLASALEKRICHRFIDIGKLAEAEHLYLRVDMKRKTKVIDERRLSRRLQQEAKSRNGNLVMATHYAEILSPRLVDKVIVLRTHPEELRRRLTQRGWSASKTQENLEAEILGVCSYNALARFGRNKVYEIDTTSLKPEQVLGTALEILEGKDRTHLIGSIDWLADLEKENKLATYMDEE